MKRYMLFFIGIGAGCLLLYGFFIVTFEPFAAARTVTAVVRDGMEFPIYMSDELCAVRLASYDGPFLEDGTDDEVIGIAALEVENTSSQMITEGEVVLYYAERALHFRFTNLPSGGRLLALEKQRSQFLPDAVLDYDVDIEQEPAAVADRIAGRIEASGSIRLENRTGGPAEAVTVYYKTYDGESDMYIGGITYRAYAGQLDAQCAKSIKAYHVAQGYTRIVKVIWE